MPELRGKLYLKKDTEIIKADFKKRMFVIETTDEQYPQKIPFELTQENTAKLDNIQIGQEITVGFNYRGTESKKEGEEPRYFLNLQAWKIN